MAIMDFQPNGVKGLPSYRWPSDVGEILGEAAQDSKGAQLKFRKVKDSYPPVFEAKGTDNKVYSFEMTSICVRLSIRSTS